MATKKVWGITTNFFFTPIFVAVSGSEMGKNQDPGFVTSKLLTIFEACLNAPVSAVP